MTFVQSNSHLPTKALQYSLKITESNKSQILHLGTFKEIIYLQFNKYFVFHSFLYLITIKLDYFKKINYNGFCV